MIPGATVHGIANELNCRKFAGLCLVINDRPNDIGAIKAIAPAAVVVLIVVVQSKGCPLCKVAALSIPQPFFSFAIVPLILGNA